MTNQLFNWSERSQRVSAKDEMTEEQVRPVSAPVYSAAAYGL